MEYNENEIYNNVVYRTDGPGINLNEPHTGYRAGHNLVRNNPMVETGLRFFKPDIAFQIGDSPDGPDDVFSVRDNTFQHNAIFRASKMPIVGYRGERLCMSGLGAKNGTFGDTFEGNVHLDPGFVNPEAHDFTFKPDSPCN